MISNTLVLIIGLAIGFILGIFAYLQSRVIWQKQGFAIVRSPAERKKAYIYRKIKKSKIRRWTYFLGLGLIIIFGQVIWLGVLNQIQVIILCFSFSLSLAGFFGLSALIFDQKIRNRK